MGRTDTDAMEKRRKLLIGGTQHSDGWEVLNANDAPYVDHRCNATDLSRFDDASFSEIYASHVVEHFDYKDELSRTLAEWHRVLTPGGILRVSVPDMDVLAKLFLDRENLSANERFFVMRMMFGGHVDQYDYHVVGLNEEFLRDYLATAGYVNIERVDDLGLFDDTSRMRFKGILISLNMVAEKALVAAPSQPPGRNQPCFCGSGKKFKHCHGKL